MQAFLQMAERERARTKFKSVKIFSVKSERIPVIIVKIVAGILRTFAHRFKTYTQYEKELSFRRIGCSSRRHRSNQLHGAKAGAAGLGD
jgi:hypothetical protein